MRKLATVRRIDAVDPIEGADAIEVCTVGGWKVVTRKGEFQAGDLAIYCEIDSFIPTPVAPFLTKPEHFPKVFEGVEGERLRTIRLRGQLSQGLLLSMSVLPAEFVEGDDVSEVLGIVKYEKPLPAGLQGVAKGMFPYFIRKTEQERCQNLKREISEWTSSNLTWEVTEKLDGSSMTMYLLDGEFGVCSRNLELKEAEGNAFWKVARTGDFENWLRAIGLPWALQGELIGPGIQGNPYDVKDHEFRLFDVWDIDQQRYLSQGERMQVVNTTGWQHVPVVFNSINLEDNEDLLTLAEGKSLLSPKAEREGLVFKCLENPSISFKAISNRFLLKEKD